MPPTCRSCDAPIIWATLPSGERMPLDALPVPDGNVLLHSDGVRALVLGKDDELEAEAIAASGGAAGLKRLAGMRYVSHCATCPHSASHRKQKRGRGRPPRRPVI